MSVLPVLNCADSLGFISINTIGFKRFALLLAVVERLANSRFLRMCKNRKVTRVIVISNITIRVPIIAPITAITYRSNVDCTYNIINKK